MGFKTVITTRRPSQSRGLTDTNNTHIRAMPHQTQWISHRVQPMVSKACNPAKLIQLSSWEPILQAWLRQILPMACLTLHTLMSLTEDCSRARAMSRGLWGREHNNRTVMCNTLLCCMISSIKTMLIMIPIPW